MTMVSPFQAFLIGLVYFAANTSLLAGLGYFTTWRPLVNGLLVGVILGDPVRGTMVGALINVLYLGYISVGGTLGIGDAALAGILGATIGVAVSRPDSWQAIGLGVIAGVLLSTAGFPLLSLRMSLDNYIVERMEAASSSSKRGAASAIVALNIVAGQVLLLIICVPAAALLAWLGVAVLNTVIGGVPIWIMRAIATAGTGMAAALGIALALKFVFRGRGVALFFTGYAIVLALRVFAPGPPINVGVLLLAGLLLFMARYLKQVARMVLAAREHHTHGAFPLWQFFSHSSYSFSRLQGSGLAGALAPAMQKLYSSPQECGAALGRHLAFFNVEPNWGSVVVGVTLKLEEEHKAGLIEAEAIAATKQALMGTVSGFGDSASQGAILPLVLSIGLSISLDPSQTNNTVIGVVAYVIAISMLMLTISYASFHSGYELGREAVVAMLSSTTLKQWIAVAQWLGAFMLGVLAAMPSVTGLHLGLTSGIARQVFDALAPLGLVLVLYFVVQKYQVSPTLVLLGIIMVTLALSLAGLV